MTTSRAVTVAEALKTEIATILGSSATVRRLWVPSFSTKEITAKPVVAIRPAGRTSTPIGKGASASAVQIEIGIVAKIAPPETNDEDPNNRLEELDAIDSLAETIFDLFVHSDDEGTRGNLATKRIADHWLTEVSQPTAVDVQHLREYRQFVTVIVLTYEQKD